jgi:hypothetical protein
MSFLFFTFEGYEASGGANDLIGKSEGDTWADLVALLDQNEADNSDRRIDLFNNVQVLDLETLEVRSAEIIADRNSTTRIWEVRRFEPHQHSEDKPFLKGIPYIEPEPVKAVTVPPFTASNALYYRITACVTVRKITETAISEKRRFAFTIRRRFWLAMSAGDATSEHRAAEMAVGTYLKMNGDRLNNALGVMVWTISLEQVDFVGLKGLECPLQHFNQLPEDGASSQNFFNPTYEVLGDEEATGPDAE